MRLEAQSYHDRANVSLFCRPGRSQQVFSRAPMRERTVCEKEGGTMITREEMLEHKDEWLARKDELRDRFIDQADDPTVDAAIGLSLVSAGLGTVVVNLFRGKRNAWAYLLPAVFILGGIAVISGGAVSRRSDRIATAEDAVREQLARLDPIARAQVLKGVASETFAPLIHHNNN
jgi:hypothetical protein